MTKAELLATVCRETAEQWRVLAEKAPSDGLSRFMMTAAKQWDATAQNIMLIQSTNNSQASDEEVAETRRILAEIQ